VEKYGRTEQTTDDNKIRRMRFACWITKTTFTHSEYVILFEFPLQQLLHECTSLAQHRFPIRCVSFFVSSMCLLVRGTIVDKNKAVVCCLLATSALMVSENKKIKRKIWSKKWYLKRNISCDAHLLNELLVTDVP
jgi:hypothetical protein